MKTIGEFLRATLPHQEQASPVGAGATVGEAAEQSCWVCVQCRCAILDDIPAWGGVRCCRCQFLCCSVSCVLEHGNGVWGPWVLRSRRRQSTHRPQSEGLQSRRRRQSSQRPQSERVSLPSLRGCVLATADFCRQRAPTMRICQRPGSASVRGLGALLSEMRSREFLDYWVPRLLLLSPLLHVRHLVLLSLGQCHLVVL